MNRRLLAWPLHLHLPFGAHPRFPVTLALISVSLSSASAAIWKSSTSPGFASFQTQAQNHVRSSDVTILAGVSCDRIAGFGASLQLNGIGTPYAGGQLPTTIEYFTDHKRGTLMFTANTNRNEVILFPVSRSDIHQLFDALMAGDTFDFNVKIYGFTSSSILFSVPTKGLKKLFDQNPVCRSIH